MTVITRTVRSSHPASLTTLQALASISGLKEPAVHFATTEPLQPPQNDSDDNDTEPHHIPLLAVEMTIKAQNPFNGTSTSYTANGLLGCARVICKAVPESGLWDPLLDGGEGMVESWIETAASVLAFPAYVASEERVKDEHFKHQVEEFAATIERHLFSTSNTFLVGDTATAADVVVSILLADAALRTNVTKVPEQAARLLGTVLNNKVLVGIVGQLEVPGVGVVSPKEKEVMAKAVVVAAAASAKGETKATTKTKTTTKPTTTTTTKTPPSTTTTSSTTTTTTTTTTLPTSTTTFTITPAPPSELTTNTIIQKLTSLSIPHTTYLHPTSTTAEELVTNVPLPRTDTHTKNLFLKDKKHGMFLVTTRTDSDVNTKALGKALDLKGKVNLRMADEKTLDAVLGVKKGCVGPMCCMNAVKEGGEDGVGGVTLVLDERLFEEGKVERIHSHPLRNDCSTALAPGDLKKFLEGVGVVPVIIPFPVKGAAPAAGAASGGGDAASPQKNKGKGGGGDGANNQKKGKKGNDNNTGKNKENKKTSKKGETLLALQWKKSENFAQWYTDVIVLSELISYYDISGCYILRPWSFKMWETIQTWFNAEIQALGVENSYFPLFVSQDRLEKEKDHVEGFAPEVAWVTKSGDGELAKPIAVRPTSETIMYPAFSDWIKSHRDLPLKLNQWANVVRWEFKDPTPFLRSREFLWQEGHTAHVSNEDANVMVMQALELYRRVYEELLAVPVVPGYKTEKEKFAGGDQTTTVEAYIAGSGRAIQGATSHNLGQNFGKMFDIKFQDEGGEKKVVWQTSWGLTTRSIGVMIMVHGDDMGLVLPPKIAPLQAVVVPIISKNLTYEDAKVYCEGILKDLVNSGIRAKYDDREMYNPGWKYNHWEQKGVPIRIEVGPRDVQNKQARIVTRYNGEKEDFPVEGLGAAMVEQLSLIQTAMFTKAKKARDEHLVQITEWKDFVPNLELNNLILTPWCGGEHQEWEEWVKDKSREESLKNQGEEEEAETTAVSVAGKSLCIPFKQPDLPEGTKCIASGLPATCWVLWGRSY